MQRSLDEIGLLSLDPRERTLFKNSSIIPIGTCRTRPGYVLRYLATHHHHQPPPPAPTNLFNFLVSFLLWIQRETIVGSDLDLCVHVAGVEIFFTRSPSTTEKMEAQLPRRHLIKRKRTKEKPFDSPVYFFLLFPFFFFFFFSCVTLVPSVITFLSLGVLKMIK